MSKKLIIIVIAVVVLLGGGGAAAFFMLRPTAEPGEQAEQSKEPPGIVAMETFLANINVPEGDRFAKLTLQLTVTPGSLAPKVTEDEILQAQMRDRVLTLLTSKTLDELIGPVGKEGLRREIRAHLNPLIEDGEIQEVLFSDFVVQ